MKNVILFFIAFAFGFGPVWSQKVQEAKQSLTTEETKEETEQFYRFEIPAAINGSNLDPAPVSNVSSDFTDSKLSVKLGFPFRDKKTIEDLRYTGFIKPSFKATNGVSTLWKSGNPPLEYGITAGFSWIFKHTTWELTSGTREKFIDDENTSSEALMWLNVIANLEQANYNLLDDSRAFDNIAIEKHVTNYGFFVSLNRYFYSTAPGFNVMNVIWSVGLGPARTNNYSSLDKRTLEEGKLVFNTDMTAYKTVVKTTAGAVGEFQQFDGLAGFAELFIPIYKNKKYFSLYFGNRFTRYAIGSSDYIANATSGLFFNIKDGKVEAGNRSAKDIVNFSIVGQFNQLNKRKEDNYTEKNFSVGLQASIPLRFN